MPQRAMLRGGIGRRTLPAWGPATLTTGAGNVQSCMHLEAISNRIGSRTIMFATHERMALFGWALALGVWSICGNLGGNETSIPAAAAQGAVTPPVRIVYGSHDPTFVQFGDLRIPSRPGPYPVAVVIHGG